MALRLFTYITIGILLLPIVTIVTTSFDTKGYVSFPPEGFTLKWYGEALARRDYIESFYLSVLVAVVTAGCATILGTLVGIGIVRYRFRGRELVNAFFMSPLILPSVVIGIALLQFYNRLRIDSTMASLILGHVIVTTPYAIRLVTASLTGLDRSIELAARSLGAPPIRAFLKVTVPLILPGMVAGAVFAFITSFDNVTISVFLTSPRIVTLPVRIYTQLERGMDPWLVALCALLILWTAVIIVVIERVVKLQALFVGSGRT